MTILEPTLLAQLTDLHVRAPGDLAFGRVDTGAALARAVSAVLALPQRPHAAVLSGDLVDLGRDDEYRALQALLRPMEAAGIALYLMPGNHDERAALLRAFPHHAYLGQSAGEPWIQFAVDVGPLRLLALDTVVPRRTGGSLDAPRLAWLERALDEGRDRPVVIAMHHPPFRTLIAGMDRYGLAEGAEALESIVARHANIERVLCGHLHRAIDVRFGGTIASTSPSPAHQIRLDLAPDAPLAWTLEPPGFRLHAWDADAKRLVSHLVACGPFEGPFPFA